MNTIKLTLLALGFLIVGTMDYQDALIQEQAMIEYADYYSQPDGCSTDTECGCTDDCLDSIED